MNETEILIRIQTALESGGIKAAEAEIAKMTSEVEKNTSAGAKNNVEGQHTIRMLRALNEALHGNVRGMQELGMGFGKVATGLGQVMGAGAAFMAGWKIGEWIRTNVLQIKDADQMLVQSTKAAADAAELSLQATRTRMEAFLSSMRSISTEMEKWIAYEDRWTAKWKEVRDAKLAAETERIKTEVPQGPEQERQIREATRQAEDASLDDRRAQLKHDLEEVQKAMGQLDASYGGGNRAGDEENRRIYNENADKARSYRADIEKNAADIEAQRQRRIREDRELKAQAMAEYRAGERGAGAISPQQQFANQVRVQAGPALDKNGQPLMSSNWGDTAPGRTAAARQAIEQAAAAMNAGGPDQAIFDALVQKLQELGARVNVSRERFVELLDALDGVKDEIKSERSKTL